MKSILYLLLAIMVFTVVTFNTSANEEEQAQITNESTSVKASKSMSENDLTKGLDNVLTSLDELKTVTKDSQVDTQAVNKAAEELGETWDKIEEKVEEKYPEDYENIEKSLYPLLAEAKKDTPNLVSVMQLLDDTTKKVQEFKEKIGTTST